MITLVFATEVERERIYAAISLGNKVNYKPSLWHWPKTGFHIFPLFSLFSLALSGPILLSANACKEERRIALLTYLF